MITTASPKAEPVISFADAERVAVSRVDQANRGRVNDMAQQLGIGRTALRRKMKRLNTSPEHFRR